MTDGLLDNIIELERRIQADVAAEQLRAEEWQARELAELLSVCAEARVVEEAHYQGMLSDQEEQLKLEGSALEESSLTWCKRLLSLDDKVLRDILKRHLAGLLPGGDHDHPHGQG